MDSDESGHSESEFYYPEEETLNQMAPINFFPNVSLEQCSRPRAQFFPIRTPCPVNNIYISKALNWYTILLISPS